MYSSYVDYTTTSIFLMSWCFLTNIIFLNLILGIFVESYNEIEAEDSESFTIKENEEKNFNILFETFKIFHFFLKINV